MSVGQDIIYRPPLWSQANTDPPAPEYSAADDRRLLHSTFWPGVVDLGELKVVPRQEGPNMSVDVTPGDAVVPGTEQVEQGSYLCPLAQRVNIPIPAGPAAGNHRWHLIFARVYEPVDAEAYWQVEQFPSQVVPQGQPPVWDPGPPSVTLFAAVGPIASNTAQITEGMIQDYRLMSRPASMGASFVKKVELADIQGTPNAFMTWGEIRINNPPYGPPVDIEARIEGAIAPYDQNAPGISGAPAYGELALDLYGGAGGGQRRMLRAGTMRWDEPSLFSRSVLIPGASLIYPQAIAAGVSVRSVQGYPIVAWLWGTLTLRVTPSGGPLTW